MKKLITLFAMFIAFIAVANARQSQLPRKSGSENLKSFKITPNYKKINKVKTWWTEMDGDIPEGVTSAFESSMLHSYSVMLGSTYKVTLSGMPENIIIDEIKISVAASQAGGVCEIVCKQGDSQVGTLKFHGDYLSDDYGIFVDNRDGGTELSLSIDSDQLTCSGQDIIFNATNIDVGPAHTSPVSIYYYIISYKEDKSTGINDIDTSASNDAIYNLQGIRVDNPVKGNIYIKGGKKIVY